MKYEKYPPLSVLASNLATFSIYLLGAILLSDIGWPVVAIYLLYCLWLEYRVLKNSCVNCYYYGKLCFSGKGLLSSIFFKKGDPKNFLCRKLTWLDILPDFLVSLVPFLAGVVMSFLAFSWLRLGLMFLLLIIGFPVTGYIRGNLACKYCKQRELGCPAAELFSGARK
jgi:hypothetical protein